MIVTGITTAQFQAAIDACNSPDLYRGNLTAEIGREYSATRFACRVVPRESGARTYNNGDCAPGARKSASGRRLKAACWHAYRDVLVHIFDGNPDARVYTAMARYIGRDGFLTNYPETAHQNIGSMARPAYMPDLCDCDVYGIPTHEIG